MESLKKLQVEVKRIESFSEVQENSEIVDLTGADKEKAQNESNSTAQNIASSSNNVSSKLVLFSCGHVEGNLDGGVSVKQALDVVYAVREGILQPSRIEYGEVGEYSIPDNPFHLMIPLDVKWK